MSYRGALWRGIKRGLGLHVEPIDYSPEAQLLRIAKALEEMEAAARAALAASRPEESLDERAARRCRER